MVSAQSDGRRPEAASSCRLARSWAGSSSPRSARREAIAEGAAGPGQGAQALSDRRWYAAEIGLAWQDWEKGRIEAGAAAGSTRCVPGQSGGADLRGFEWYYLNRLCHLESPHPSRIVPEPLRSVAFSPDGRHLASGGGRDRIGKPGTIRALGRGHRRD